MMGICSHLGCVLFQQREYNGWFCPCHGSHYDTSGRIRKVQRQQIWKFQNTFIDDNQLGLDKFK